MTDEPDKAGKSGAIGLTVAVVTNEQVEALLDGVNALVSALTAISEQLRTSTLGLSAVAADLPERPTVKDVALWLRLSPNTVYDFCRKKQIPHVRIGRSYRFNKADLLEWARKYSQ